MFHIVPDINTLSQVCVWLSKEQCGVIPGKRILGILLIESPGILLAKTHIL